MRKQGTQRITILSTADFDAELWTNKQHLAVGLAEYGYDVQYINSLGLRRPKASISDLRRIARRLRRALRTRSIPRKYSNNHVSVVDVNVIPFHGSSLVRAINKRIVTRKFRDSSGDILWTFSPITYGLENQHDYTVYHSVDLLHSFPGIPQSVFMRGEETMCSTAHAVIGSSQIIVDHLRELRRDVLKWENVADTSLFMKHRNCNRDVDVIFAGNLTSAKLDLDLLRAVASLGLRVAIAGPVAIDGDTETEEIRELLTSPLVEYLGTLSAENLAEWCGRAKVGLIPYKINDYTIGVFPLKVYEYLASGLVVVSTNLPSLADLTNEYVHVESRNDFVSAVRLAVKEDLSMGERERVSESAAPHSWHSRIREADTLIQGFERQ